MPNGLSTQIFAYCERGLDPSFWAEPFNALSNAAFFIAAAVGAAALAASPAARVQKRPMWAETGLVALVAIIGLGSFLFHTLATRWAAIADGAPIGLFMLAYVAYALRRFLEWPMWAAILGLAAFVATLGAAFAAPCPLALRSLVKGGGCLNGSLGYGPALSTLALVATATTLKRHPSAGYLAAATVVFAASLVMRSLDQQVCGATQVWGQSRGTHALWHLLNAITLGLLLLAAIRHGRSATRPAD